MAEVKPVSSQDEFIGGLAVRHSHDQTSIKHVPLWYSVRRWRKVVGYCFALSISVLLYGYDFVVVGTVSAMPAFQ